jgi:uncharacterized protein (TIGR01777 family)
VSQIKRIVIAGGSGFIGGALVKEFSRQGYAVSILTRSPKNREDGIRQLAWDGENSGEWLAALNGAEAVINLTGQSINVPHTPENLRIISSTRVNSIKAIAASMSHVKQPPRVWVQASAIGFYGDTGDHACDETAPNGHGAVADICHEWEGAFNALKLPGTRKATLRMGFALGREGGALPVLASLARIFLGGAAGNGRQFISWVHIQDLAQMFVTAVENEKVYGPFNAVSPNPVTNAEFMRELRRAYRRPWSPPVPAFAVKLGAKFMGGEPSLALISHRCMPGKFNTVGFDYQFPQLSQALRDLCRGQS